MDKDQRTQGPNEATDAPAAASGPRYRQARGNAARQEACGDHSSSGPEAEVGAPRAGAPTSYRRALRRHEQNRQYIDRLIRSALEIEVDPNAGADSRANLLRNTAQWIDQGEADLYVVTPTHDADRRPNCPANENAYFDTRVTYDQAGASYDPTLDASSNATNDVGLVYKRSRVAGTMDPDGRRMTLVDPTSFSESKVVHFFIHEVQHDADQHNAGESWEASRPPPVAGQATRAPQWAYNNYQTEFRAYWMMNPEGSSVDQHGASSDTGVTNIAITAILSGADGSFGTTDDISRTVSTAFTNKRQQDIFMHMFRGGRSDNIYLRASKWTKSYAYLPHYYALDPAFKQMVDAYTVPKSGNLINSPRIQVLSRAIANTSGIVSAIQGLDDLDIAYLNDRQQSQPFWDQATLQLSPTGLRTLESHLQTGTAGPFLESVEVVNGDTLGAIADRMLGNPNRWREVYEINRGVIGPDPNLIIEGQVLRLPQL